MFRFFRQIRQRLLIDNKFSKYLLYAVGEILLVVIGILIALQVDSWNEDRKEKEFANKVLRDLSISVNQNIDNLRFNIHANETAIESGELIARVLDNDLPYHDSLDLHFSQAVGFSTPTLDNGAYESLKSYGLYLIKNDSIVKSLEILNNEWPEILVRRQEQYFASTASPVLTEYFEDVAMHTEMKPWDYEALKKSKAYRSVLNTSIDHKREANRNFKWWLKQIEILYEMINQELSLAN